MSTANLNESVARKYIREQENADKNDGRTKTAALRPQFLGHYSPLVAVVMIFSTKNGIALSNFTP